MTPSRRSILAGLLAATYFSSHGLAAAKSTRRNKEVQAYLTALPLTGITPDSLKARADTLIALAKKLKAKLEAHKGKATLDKDFVAFDILLLLVGDGTSEFYLISETYPDKACRDAAQAALPGLSELGTAISLSRPIYDRLSAIPQAGLDETTAFTLNKVLTNYRLAGVDKDEATRAKVGALQTEITEIGLKFAANIRDDKGDVTFKPEELKGLPQDYIDSHPVAADGLIHLTYDYPDAVPVFTFADLRETRKKMAVGYNDRGWPANDAVLKNLLEKRYELASTLGYPDYATLITADKMIGNPQRAAAFLEDVSTAADAQAKAEMAELLAFAQTVDPSITQLEGYDSGYMNNKLRVQKYQVDAAEVRQYFTYDKARAGIFGLISDLFGAEFRPATTLPVWHESVSAWELHDKSGALIGKFYLDMHPRDGKFNHAAAFPVRTGVSGQQLPIAGLICNFPATGPMSHGDVSTFLHEFGHLIHMLYSGHTQYSTQSMGNIQWDFIEAPSQLLEEWVWDYDTLKTFASNDKGEPIPEALVKKMNNGRRFGEGIGWKRQVAYAAVSLNFYNRKPDFELSSMYDEQYNRYSPIRAVPGTHSYASFGHLDGYSAIYYTYVWSKTIALDLFTQFKTKGMRNPEVAAKYRKLVLEPGGSKDANVLIQDFLGRPLSMDSFRDSLQGT